MTWELCLDTDQIFLSWMGLIQSFEKSKIKLQVAIIILDLKRLLIALNLLFLGLSLFILKLFLDIRAPFFNASSG